MPSSFIPYILRLIKVFFVTLLVTFVTWGFSFLLTLSPLAVISSFIPLLDITLTYLFSVAGITLLFIILFSFLDSIFYQQYDKLGNWVRSVSLSAELLGFMHQDDATVSLDGTPLKSVNKINKRFNKDIKNSYVRLDEKTVKIVLVLPKSSQGFQLYQGLEATIQEHFSERLSTYHFSAPVTSDDGTRRIINGTRKKH